MSYFDGIKVGDKVYSLNYGEGVVDYVCRDEHFAIRVQFDCDEVDSFTKDGKIFSFSLTQDLYWQKPDITIIDKGKRLPDLPVDAKILVRDCDADEWLPRHFSHFKDGMVFCWDNGCTSFTQLGAVGWKQWKLPEDEV